MTLWKAIAIVTRLIVKGRWHDASTISAPLMLAWFFSLTGFPDDALPSGAGAKE